MNTELLETRRGFK